MATKLEVRLNTCGCNRPSIAVMDYQKPTNARWTKFAPYVNRVCLTCYAHWFGPVRAVKQFTRKEWDAYVGAKAA